VPTIRARYKAQRDAMRAALEAHLPRGCRWSVPVGGMFFWVELPAAWTRPRCCPGGRRRRGLRARGAFYADKGHANTLRLSFVTVPPERITQGVAALGRVLQEALA
jgi:2-aminoadipate transaminase